MRDRKSVLLRLVPSAEVRKRISVMEIVATFTAGPWSVWYTVTHPDSVVGLVIINILSWWAILGTAWGKLEVQLQTVKAEREDGDST